MPTFGLNTALPTLTAGLPVVFALSSGGGVAPLSFTITAGVVPVGLVVDPVTGILSGTPQIAGPYDFTIMGADSTTPTPNVVVMRYTGTIASPVVSSLGALEAGEPLVPYAIIQPPPLPAFPISTPFTSTIIAGTLPDGLYLNSNAAVISGTPTTPGQYDFTVQVVDSLGVTTTVAFTGTITGVLLVIEDGSVVAGANSYFSIAQANAILALEPIDTTAWNALSATKQAVYIIAATRWIDDRIVWTGDRKTDPRVRNWRDDAFPKVPLQPRAWPRRGAFDRERRRISEVIVPEEVRRATALIANYLLTSNGEEDDQAGIRRFRADTFEMEYQQGWYKSPCPSWLKFVLFGLGQPGNELGFKKIVRV